MPYTYMAVKATTGEIIESLPQFACDTVSRQLGAYTQTTGTFPVPTAPYDWRQATQPGATVMVLVDVNDSTSVETPVWGGLTVKRDRDTGDVVTVSLATFEAVFDRRLVGDQSYSATAPEAIMADLANKYLQVGISPNVGFPLRVAVTSPTGIVVDRDYAATDLKSVYAAFQELSAVAGGPEWTVTWEYSADHTLITPVLWIGGRIGKAATPGLNPDVTFTLPGIMTDFSYDEDYSSSNGGNAINATSSATSEFEQVVLLDTSRPTFEIVYSPTLDDDDSLDPHAQAEALAVLNGVNTLTMAGKIVAGSKVGVDWDAGDDLGYQVGGTLADGTESVPAFPGGISGVVRAIGWNLQPNDRVQAPILQDPGAV